MEHTPVDLPTLRQGIETKLAVPAFAAAASFGQLMEDLVPGHTIDRDALAVALAAAVAAGMTRLVSSVFAVFKRHAIYKADGPTDADVVDGCGAEWAAKGL